MQIYSKKTYKPRGCIFNIMIKQTEPEYWQRGPVEGIPALLQPVAHALLQARFEINELLKDFDDALLWKRPAGVASVAFHLQHVSGVIDRLFTYARGSSLSEEQLAYLKQEGNEEGEPVTAAELAARINTAITTALAQLTITPENTLTEARGIGRKQIPTTVLGLLFHAAEHTQRHTGQLLVTVSIVRDRYQSHS